MIRHELFKRLVENGLDFLSRSIDEFESDPKYSVVHFHAAIELFLKARLFAEHWSLVVSRRSDPDWEKFVSGDFHSTSIEEAAAKLEKVVRSRLRSEELETFKRLARHRNKMLHFFHEAISARENEELRAEIAKELLTAWYFLHRLLTSRWSDVFSNWSGKLEGFDKRLRRLHEYLQAVFDQLRPEIKKRKERGAEFRDCASCGFPSQELRFVVGSLRLAECLVCGLADKCITIECPACATPVKFENEGFATCINCEQDFDPMDLASALIEESAAHVSDMDGDDFPPPGNCSDCGGYHTVVLQDGERERYVCASCFGVFDLVTHCRLCDELNTGDMTFSEFEGCSFCDVMEVLDRN